MAREPFRFDVATHTYRVGARRYPSITGVLRESPLARTGPWFTQAHRDRGHAVHEACLSLDLGGDPQLVPEWRGYLDAYKAFSLAMRPIRWRQLEAPRVFLSTRLWFAGTPDRIGTVRGWPTVLEIKAGVPAEVYALQTAAQDILTGRPIGHARRLVVYLAPDGRFRLKEHTDAGDYLRFLNLLAEYHEAHGGPAHALEACRAGRVA